jgi:hypothetical protein
VFLVTSLLSTPLSHRLRFSPPGGMPLFAATVAAVRLSA